MDTIIRLIAVFVFCSINLFAQEWSVIELEKANTAKDVLVLTSEEKEVIRYINLARLYPQKFAQVEIEKNMDSYSVEELSYVKSLLSTLKNTKALSALYFDEKMYELAKCFAIESGNSGYVGHGRKNCKGGFNAECCSYGYNNYIGKNVVIQLLIDADVPSLGHRKICLSNSVFSVGASIQPHKKYEYCCVVDFKAPQQVVNSKDKSKQNFFKRFLNFIF